MAREKPTNKYWLIFLYSFRAQVKNWPILLSLSAIFVTVFFVFFYLFKAAGSFSPTISTDALIWYAMLNEFMLVAGQWFHLSVQADIKNGTLSACLIKPISYLPMKAVDGIASSIINFFAIGAVTVGLTFWWTGVFPFTCWQFFVVVSLAFIGLTLQLFFAICLGLFAFWVDDVTPLYWLFGKALFFFGGLFMPLITYPLFIQKIAAFTPFPSILGDRSAQILLEPFSWNVFWISFLWLAISTVFAYFIYKQGLIHENRYGGAL